jgi:hypothetical protein
MAYSELEPFGEERADLRLAAILRMLFAINRDSKITPDVPSVSEFYGNFLADLQERPKSRGSKDKPQGIAKRQTWQEQKAMLLEFAVRQAVIHEAEQRRAARIAAKRVVAK